jgi:hypothetical protein
MGLKPSSATGRRSAGLVLGLLALTLAGCGHGEALGSPRVPLVPGAQVIYKLRRCDPGHHVFCGLEVVVADRRFTSSGALVTSEVRRLKALGWALQQGEINQEQTALSPNGKLRIVYATAANDLLAIDFGWAQRTPEEVLTLAHTMFNRTPAMSLLLEAGPS